MVAVVGLAFKSLVCLIEMARSSRSRFFTYEHTKLSPNNLFGISGGKLHGEPVSAFALATARLNPSEHGLDSNFVILSYSITGAY